MTHALCSLPPASLAVMMTFFVITGLLAFVIFHSSSSQGITCSIWYLRRRATRVTSAGGIAGSMQSLAFEGRTGERARLAGGTFGVLGGIGRLYAGGIPRGGDGLGR